MIMNYITLLLAVTLGFVSARVPVLTNQAVSSLFEVDEPTRHTLSNWEWENCGAPDDIIDLHSIEVSPDPPEAGKDLTVSVAGVVRKTIKEGAYADVMVKLGLIKLLTKTFNLCEEARSQNATIQCPVGPGGYIVSHTVVLPKEVPPAKFGINVNAFNMDDEPLLCLKIIVDFRPKFPHFNV